MRKIKDRFVLSMVAGMLGASAKLIVDEISVRKKISKRTYRETAAGVWVNNHKEATSLQGNLLGMIMDFGLSMLGANIKISIISKYGRDHTFLKGAFFGASYGAVITGLLSMFATNKVKPKDAASNLSYVFANSVYGLVTTFALAKLGDDSVFDSKPLNDYVKPTLKTSEQIRLQNINQESQIPSESPMWQ